MSRIGKKPILIPDKTDVQIESNLVKVKGQKGELEYRVHENIDIEKKNNQILLSIKNKNNKKDCALWGTNRQLVNNIIIGVNSGYEKKLEINGVGYKVESKGQVLILHVGYSHTVEYEVPKEVDVKVEKNIIILQSIDKRLLGETAASIRRIKKPEPYKGKGIKYLDEVIKRKAGKQVKSGA